LVLGTDRLEGNHRSCGILLGTGRQSAHLREARSDSPPLRRPPHRIVDRRPWRAGGRHPTRASSQLRLRRIHDLHTGCENPEGQW